MEKRYGLPSPAKLLAGGVAVGVAAYGAYVASTWGRYGTVPKPAPDADSLLDAFVPRPEVALRHQIHVNASALETYDVACGLKMADSAVVNALFKVRELVFGHPTTEMPVRDGLLEQLKAIGWIVLAEVPGREMVFGTATQPWRNDAVLPPIAPADFAAFNEPGNVKIIWTLRIDPLGPSDCIARTETRVSTTDEGARSRFRLYWSFLSPGIRIIRHVMLRRIKSDAEARSLDAIDAAL